MKAKAMDWLISYFLFYSLFIKASSFEAFKYSIEAFWKLLCRRLSPPLITWILPCCSFNKCFSFSKLRRWTSTVWARITSSAWVIPSQILSLASYYYLILYRGKIQMLDLREVNIQQKLQKSWFPQTLKTLSCHKLNYQLYFYTEDINLNFLSHVFFYRLLQICSILFSYFLR